MIFNNISLRNLFAKYFAIGKFISKKFPQSFAVAPGTSPSNLEMNLYSSIGRLTNTFICIKFKNSIF